MKEGHVYFVEAPGRIKVGFTMHPDSRLKQLQSFDMEKLTVIGIIYGSRALERHIHKLLHGHHQRGEWFNDCPEVRAVIERALAGEIAIAPTPTKTSELTAEEKLFLMRLPIADAKQEWLKLQREFFEIAFAELKRRKAAGIDPQPILKMLDHQKALLDGRSGTLWGEEAAA